VENTAHESDVCPWERFWLFLSINPLPTTKRPRSHLWEVGPGRPRLDSDNGGYQARIGFPDHFGGGSPARKPQEMRWPKIAQTPEIPMSRFIDCCRSKNECVTRMRLETKFVRLKTSVKIGSRFGEWKVCWLGGWIRDLLHTS
jgi:hypothetical protein